MKKLDPLSKRFMLVVFSLWFVAMLSWAAVGWGLYDFVYAITTGSPTATTALISVAPLMTGIYMLTQALVLDIQETAR